MKLVGLTTLLESLFKSKLVPEPWGIKAKHHPYRLQAKPANPAKKKRRQIVQASKRRNRRRK